MVIEMRKNGRYFVSFALCAGLLFSGCGSKEAVEAESAILVDAAQVGRDTLVLSNQFVGTIAPEESVYIIPLAQGKVTETFFEVGDEVKEGDVLFKIDDSGAKLQLEQAQLSLQSAKQQANSALTTQQESTNIQLETSKNQAWVGYVQAQAAWKSATDAYDQYEKQYKNANKAYKQAKDAGMDAASLAELKAARDAIGVQKNSMETQVNVAEAALEAAEEGYKAVQESADLTHGAVLSDTKKQLNTSLSLANLGVESAELALSYYQVTTPIAGKVISKSVEVNGMATSASPAYIIAAEDSMTVTFQVSESIRNTLKNDMKIVVERAGKEYDGVITEVGNAVNMQTGLFQIKASVHANGEQLPGGVSVKITSDTYTASDAIVIPYDAVYYETGGAYVYAVRDGHAVKTYVTTGIFDDERIEITGGITEEDVIITSWSPRLIDGAEVDAKLAAPQTAAQ